MNDEKALTNPPRYPASPGSDPAPVRLDRPLARGRSSRLRRKRGILAASRRARGFVALAVVAAGVSLVLLTAGFDRDDARGQSPGSHPGLEVSSPSSTEHQSALPSPSARPIRVRQHTPSPIPGYLLIADRGNDRMLLVDSGKHVLWRYPKPGRGLSFPFNFDDDAFLAPNWRSIISNQEEQQTIEVISFPGGSLKWHYGHVGAAGSAAGYLHTPDDAYLLSNGDRIVADVGNCRVLVLSPTGRLIRQYGTTDVCAHSPPRLLGSPNGDTPVRGGGVLITEIMGSYVDLIGPHGNLLWSVHAPVAYPSDAQWLGGGRILLADYSSPGQVLILSRSGNVLWRYGPASGPGALDHPSLALRLPNGLIAVNDDFRDRVVLIDPKRHRVVWQYGHTDRPGSSAGFLDIPDGMDFLPFRIAMSIRPIRKVVDQRR